jgi:hypothetical protein
MCFPLFLISGLRPDGISPTLSVKDSAMPRKPFLIVLMAGCFFVSPFFIILQASLFTLTPVIGPYNIFAKLSPHDLIVLILYPVCAAAIFLVRKWSWYVYILAAVCLAADNVVVFLLRPQYHVLALIFYNLVLAIAAGIFFRRAVIAPYFNPGLRWWEQPVRFGLGLYLTITGQDGRPVQANIVDISATGVFAVCLERLSEEAGFAVTLHALGHTIHTHVRVRRRVPHELTTGYGLQFEHRDATQKIALETLLGDLRRAGLVNRERQRLVADKTPTAPRFRLNAGARIETPLGALAVVVIDLSRTGCLLGLPPAAESGPRGPFRLDLQCFDARVSVPCEARWTGRFEGRAVLGVAFRFEDKAQRKLVRRIVAVSRRAGAADRRKSAPPLPAAKLTELALKSPYRLIYGLKKRIRLP